MHPHVEPEVVELDASFRSIDADDRLDGRLLQHFERAWPAYQKWYLSQGEAARPTYAECRQAIQTHMPELAGTYDALVEAVGGGDLEARFLSHWCPPPLFAACSMLTYTRDRNVLIRNYDYPPMLCDNVVLRSKWHGTPVMAMTDCLWGALDGVNAHGLSVAIAFGGRPVVGTGFGIGLVVRYVLEFATSVADALAILRRVPVQLAYNVALVDSSGDSAIVYVGPDRDTSVSPLTTAGNRQGQTEWPEHAAFCDTVTREEVLVDVASDGTLGVPELVDRFLRPPVHRSTAASTWGTVYTATYDSDLRTLELSWPDGRWHLSLDAFEESEHPRRSMVAVPPPVYEPPTDHVPEHPPVLIA
ncbi:MAG TPA: C45 family peptidase [Actinomycetes bacterium]|nr:C45 family peptidase [Actinomycetes bacterium]